MSLPFRMTCALVALTALTACSDAPLGSEIDGGSFGSATQSNAAVMTGQVTAVVQLGQRFAAEVEDTITFAFNSAILDAQAQATLRQQAAWIRQFPEVRFRVYGHTDLVGSQSYNHSLGKRRAEAVVAYLATQGISRSRLEALVSYGKTRPVINTQNEERANRRTVTEVSGFVQRHPTVMDGKYAQIVHRNYIVSAARPHPANTVITTQISEGVSQ